MIRSLVQSQSPAPLSQRSHSLFFYPCFGALFPFGPNSESSGLPFSTAVVGSGHRTLRNNVALLDDELIQRNHASIVAAGRAGFREKSRRVRRGAGGEGGCRCAGRPCKASQPERFSMKG